MSPSGGEVLLDLFKNSGIENIFCSPGTEWVPVWEALSKSFGQGERTFRYFDCRHETLAVSMAMGYTESTKKLAAVLLHAGVGPLNAAMAIRTAYMSEVPMLILSAESTDHSGLDSRPPGGHWISVLSDMGGPANLVKPYVKWSNNIASRDSLIDSIYRACQIALSPPMGPVFLSVSRELLLKSIAAIETSKKTFHLSHLPEPNEADMQEIARQLVDSKLPIIITESAGRNQDNVSKLTELAELLSMPVFERNHPHFANINRHNSLYMGSDVKEILPKVDTVLIVKSTIPWYPPSSFPPNAKTILIDESTLHEKLPYWGYQIDFSIASDIGRGLSKLISLVSAELKKRGGHGYQERLEFWKIKHQEIVSLWEKKELEGKGRKPISSHWFFHTIRGILPENSIILNESIVHTPLIEWYLAEVGRYARLGYGALGTGLGQAAGVKLASPDRPVVIFVGDGSFNYNPVPAVLGLCQQYKIPIMIVVLNNGCYMTMKEDHDKSYPQGWCACHNEYLGFNIAPQPDYAKLAEAFGGSGERLDEPDEIGPVVRRALAQMQQGKIALLDVVIDSP